MIKCIIVDDEPLAVAQLEKYVERVPFLANVGSCSSAAEAMELLSAGDVDVMFVDINMPDIDGVQFVRSLVHPPMVVFTTAMTVVVVAILVIKHADNIKRLAAGKERRIGDRT